MEPQMNTDDHRYENQRMGERPLLNVLSLSASICVYLWLILLSSCSAKPTDMRSLVPAETLVYLETNDLAAALQPIVDSKPFTEVAKSKPDFSALKGVQLAVAVTGFETSEEKLTDEHSVGRVQPHFVAIADTHGWNYQTVAFAEQKLGGFVEKVYDNPPTLDRSDKNGGKYFTWTAKDGRKAYVLVIDSLIYFGNDESAIDKVLAVRRGETESIAKASKVPPSAPGTLSSGYVSTDGIAQIANIIGLKFASEAGEDSEVQSAIAGILPQLLRSSITEISWTATKTEQGVEDKYKITMPPEIANVFSETIVPSGEAPEQLFSNLPELPTATRYNLKSPQKAWISVLLVLKKQIDPIAGKMLGQLSGAFFEPYGIRDAEMFLSSVDPNLITANVDWEGEHPFVVATTSNPSIKKALVSDLKPVNENFWRGDESDTSALFNGERIVIGTNHALAVVVDSGGEPKRPTLSEQSIKLRDSKAPITTFGAERSSSRQIAEMLSEKFSDDENPAANYYTETRFIRTGIDRRTVSDFGLIGSIIAQLAAD